MPKIDSCAIAADQGVDESTSTRQRSEGIIDIGAVCMRTTDGYLIRPHRQWDKRAAVEKELQEVRNDELQ